MKIRMILSAVAALLVAGCNSEAAMDASVQYTVLVSTEDGFGSPREIRVISDQQSLEAVWARFLGGQGPVPNIDFQTQEVLFASLGGIAEGAGGYSLKVEKMERQEVPETKHVAIVAPLRANLQPVVGCGSVGITHHPTVVASYEKIENAVLIVQETVAASKPCRG